MSDFKKVQKPGTSSVKVPTNLFNRGGASAISSGGGDYGVFVNASTGEEKDFGSTKPPPGWVKKGVVDVNAADGAGGGGGFGGGEMAVDPFALALMASEFNANAVPEVLNFATSSGFELAREGTRQNVAQFAETLKTLFPGYGKLLKNMEDEANAFMEGRLPKATADLLYREAGERGVARGVFGQRAQYEGLTSIRDKQLQVMEVGFEMGSELRARADSIAAGLQINPVATTLDIFAKTLPLFTLTVEQAINTELANVQNALEGEKIELGYAGLALEEQKFAWSVAESQRQQAAQERAAKRSGLGSLIGGGLGAVAAIATGGLSLAATPGILAATGLGSSLGGAFGSLSAGDYSGFTQGLGLSTGYAGAFSPGGVFTSGPYAKQKVGAAALGSAGQGIPNLSLSYPTIGSLDLRTPGISGIGSGASRPSAVIIGGSLR